MEADLTFKRFSEVNLDRCKNHFNHGINDWSLSDWMTATMGELGEAANIVKKLNRHRDGLNFTNQKSEEEFRKDLADEIADTFIYIDLLAQSEGFDLATIVKNKFNRTSDKHSVDIKV